MALKSLRIFTASLVVVYLASTNVQADDLSQPNLLEPRIVGDWVHFFDPNEARNEHKGEWYCNDHTLVRDSKNQWHAYGIIGFRPPKPWTKEKQFFHATSDSLTKKSWQDHGYAMTAKTGKEAVIWAPHARLIKDQLWMFYNVGNLQPTAESYASWGGLCIARSQGDDGFNWKREKLNPLFSDHGHARDSFIARFGDLYFWYYTRTATEIDLSSAVAVRTSPDLIYWSGPTVVQTQEKGGHWAGNSESPQVIERNGVYYFFVTAAMQQYNKTLVYWSKDPLSFPKNQLVTQLNCHASEIIQDNDGKWYISTCGWKKNGLYLAELTWDPVESKGVKK